MFKTLIALILLIVLIANFPQQSLTLGNKAIETIVAFASGSYKVGKATLAETRSQVSEKIENSK